MKTLIIIAAVLLTGCSTVDGQNRFICMGTGTCGADPNYSGGSGSYGSLRSSSTVQLPSGGYAIVRSASTGQVMSVFQTSRTK